MIQTSTTTISRTGDKEIREDFPNVEAGTADGFARLDKVLAQ